MVISAVPSFPEAGPTPFAVVELIDERTEAVVPVGELSWLSLGGAEATMAVHPLELLAPWREYRVEVTPIAYGGEPSASPTAISRFTTSDAVLEPLVLSGDIGLSLRGTDVDVLADCDTCGGGCVTVGKRRTLMADVKLPVPSGGQGTYRGIVHFSDDTPVYFSASEPWDFERLDAAPHEFHSKHYVKLGPGEALSSEQTVFEEASPYAGCFTFVVWDPAGHSAHTSACLPSLAAEDIRALSELETPLELAADEDDAAEQVQVAAWGDGRDKRSTVLGGCALGTNAPSGSPGWFALLASLVLLRRRS